MYFHSCWPCHGTKIKGIVVGVVLLHFKRISKSQPYHATLGIFRENSRERDRASGRDREASEEGRQK